MTTTRNLLVAALMFAGAMFSASQAMAICVILTANITPLAGSTGTYTPPTAPTSHEVDLTITGTVASLPIGTCTVGISFQRAVPASMAISGGGGATLPYTITSASGGGNTLFYTGTPTASQVATVVVTPSLLSYTATIKIFLLAQPGTPQAAGNYSETIPLNAFNVTALGNVGTLLGSSSFVVSGSVAKTCTIGGISHPAADNAVIPIKPGGVVDTTPIPKSYANAACNTPSNLQLSSANGGVKNTATPPAGFTNIINYSAVSMFAGATATLNTATIPAASGTETGTAVSTTGATPSGTLSLTITPQANTQLLTVGSYSDTLTITITPQ
jgi:hypothetical protein